MKLLVAASNEPLARAIRGTLLGAQHEVDQSGTREATLDAIIAAQQGQVVAEAEVGTETLANDQTQTAQTSAPAQNTVPAQFQAANDADAAPVIPYDAIVLDEDLVEPPHNDFVAQLRSTDSSLKILLLATTPLSHTTGEGNRWRALPHEYAPIESNQSTEPAASSGSNQPGESDSSTEQPNNNQPDAVLRKPFSDTELLSYVNALAADSPAMIIRGNLTLDTTHHRAYYASTHSPITLSRLEYSLLEALVKADGKFVNTKELVGLVGGPYFEQQGLLRNALYTLDKKLTRAGLIMTQRGSNYRIR
ncbi:response regulator [Bifidobacterium saguini DSM 23967]|uniref:Response regulator n=2 Tax=Bifidobacterium saguini TaxID=762210 RepID=A0A087DD81_9BIFI|nr:response regulator transcription factor [Bifidobacterium saguini]KFI93481.1 response regulator [Bifidobacterium saguini DSM 23967]QTB90669.1 response regulator transcription factor [Bifidobacterium saguini]